MLCILKTLSAWNYVIWALSDSLDLMAGWVRRWLSGVRTRLRQRRDLLLEFIVLHHQLAVLQRTGTRRPCFRPSERLFWVFLSHWWANWHCGLIIVQPVTVLRWRHRGFWAICGSGSCGRWRGGRPRISSEVRALVVRMSRENFLWGAPRIHGELLKLGVHVSQATVSRSCRGGAIRPPRPGAPSCGTRHLRSEQPVLAKQDGYQTRFLLSSAFGSRELSGASPRCGMASLAGLSSHRTDCRHIALPIVLIGAPFMVVACRSLLGPPL
jgi:hypothetical protein